MCNGWHIRLNNKAYKKAEKIECPQPTLRLVKNTRNGAGDRT